jgi:hypothetical protein
VDSAYSQEQEYDEKHGEEYNEKHGDNDSDGHHTATSFSPRQTQGALTLTPEDIRSRIAAGKARNAAQQQQQQQHEKENEKKEKDNGFAELMPALSMMRTGGTDSSANGDDFLFSTPTPQTPPPSYVKPTSQLQPQQTASPVMSSMPMQPMPANVMSPDEMLRAYAERKKMAAGMGAGMGGKPAISYPMPVASTTTAAPSNMRVLYNAATSNVTPTHTGSGSGSFVPTEYTPSEYDAAYQGGLGMEADAYDGMTTGQYAFGHHPNGSIGVGQYGGAQYAIGDEEHEEHDGAYQYRAA